MSAVSNVILVFAVGENKQRVIQTLREFKYNGIDSFIIVPIDDESLPHKWYGGSKVMESNICLGSYNHLDVNGLVAFLHNIDWEYPEDVQLMVRGPNDFRFTIIDVFPSQS